MAPLAHSALSRNPTFAKLPQTKFGTPRQPAKAALPNLMGAARAARNAEMGIRDSSAIQGGPERRVVCYGDSLTAGFTCGGRQYKPYGPALRQGLATAGMPCDVQVCGLTGYTSEEMLRELDAPRATDQFGGVGKGLRYMINEGPAPELVVIMAGTNDLGYQRDVDEAFSDICQLHAACHECGVPTLCVSPPHFLMIEEQARLTQLLRKWARKEPLVEGFIDIDEILPQTNRQLWDNDKLHCSIAGYQHLGRQLSNRVAKLLDTGDIRNVEDLPEVSNRLAPVCGGTAHEASWLWSQIEELLFWIPKQ